jgi:LysM repeat protein
LGPVTYTVQPGDTLFAIAAAHGTTVAQLVALNGIADPNMIAVGQVLVISADQPPPAPAAGGGTYTVVPGDTLFAIARRFGVTVADLVQANGIGDPNQLAVGQVLVIPGLAPAPQPVATPPTEPVPAPTDLVPAAVFGPRAGDPALAALVPLFNRWADAYALPRDLLKALAFVESSWRNEARSTSGAIGLGQLLPSTAAWVNSTLLGGANLDPTVADDNLHLTARYLRYLFDLQGDESRAIGSYSQGPGSVQRDGLSPRTVDYVQRIQGLRPQFV